MPLAMERAPTMVENFILMVEEEGDFLLGREEVEVVGLDGKML